MANRTLGTRQKLVFRGPDQGGVAGRAQQVSLHLLGAPASLRKTEPPQGAVTGAGPRQGRRVKSGAG